MGARTWRRTLSATLPGVVAALLVSSCGGSGKGLIPGTYAGPLQGDFEHVVLEAESGGGSCSGTEAALLKTEQDYEALPASVDLGLRRRLREGIASLRKEALVLCANGHSAATVTSTNTRTQHATAPPRTTTTPAATQTTPTQTTPANTTTTAPEGGGTPAPSGSEASPGSGQGAGGSPSPGGGEAGASGAAGNGPAPQGSGR